MKSTDSTTKRWAAVKQKANGARLGLRAPSKIKAWKQAECDSLPPFTFVPLIIERLNNAPNAVKQSGADF